MFAIPLTPSVPNNLPIILLLIMIVVISSLLCAERKFRGFLRAVRKAHVFGNVKLCSARRTVGNARK
ncbi:MAG: hypothetical protein L6V93_11275 [Clostridiales bacterium]|nr:MAG: hypothetical protein L6V93_11275 [Clostridiales bacterium]